MTEENSRRQILQSIGTAAVGIGLGSVQAGATRELDQAAPDAAPSPDPMRQFEDALQLVNADSTEHSVQVEISQRNGSAVFSESYSLGGCGPSGKSDHVSEPVGLLLGNSSEYEVTIRTDTGEEATTTFNSYSKHLPTNQQIRVRIQHGGSLRVTTAVA